MNDAKSYVPPFRLNEAMQGGAVGTVIESRADEVPVGTTVLHPLGWREYAILDADHAQVIDPTLAPPQAYLGVLGTTGLTAYVGLTEIAAVKEGEVVFVSGAAGAVGSVAGQIARKLGAAIDYRAGDLRGQLAAAAPGGINVYFDNVGGDHLQAAIAALRVFGRVAMCGAISQYNATEPPPGPNNLSLVVGKRLTLRGFIIMDHQDRLGEYIQLAAGWLRDGSLHTEETVVDGIENAVDAFLGVLRGANIGKMLVRLQRS
jgi:hypothetical protein